MEAWVKPAPGESGRIFDKCTPGHADGFLLDTNGSSLRLIIGPEQLLANNCLKPGQWQHVAVTLDRPNPAGGSSMWMGKVVAKRDDGTAPPSDVTMVTCCSGS